jgi:UDP-N-acetyl-D-galactosamine dehydrogenase
VRELEAFGIAIQLHDPKADSDLLREEYQLELTPLDKLQPADAVVLAVAHSSYRKDGWDLITPLLRAGAFVADVPALLDAPRRRKA